MKFYPFTHLYSDLRDWGLFDLLVRSLERLNDTRVARLTAFHDPATTFRREAVAYCREHGIRLVPRAAGYDCWGDTCKIQVDCFRQMAAGGGLNEGVDQSDFIVSLDSDVVFMSSALFDHLDHQEFVGFGHRPMTFVPDLAREWFHTSGCFQAARVDKVRGMAALSDDDVRRAFAQLTACGLPLIHDLVISYLFAVSGAATDDLDKAVFMGEDVVEAFSGRSPPKSFVHLVGDWRTFMNEPVANKWDLARLLHPRFPPRGTPEQPPLDELYAQRLAATESDIFQHLPTLRAYAARCDHVTELGIGEGSSTFAFLHAQPKRLVSYDPRPFALEKIAARVAGRTDFSFRRAEVREMMIEETDLLFIDSLRGDAQPSNELELHAPRVRRFIILHNTTSPGPWPAIDALLAGGTFALRERFDQNRGLAVLERV